MLLDWILNWKIGEILGVIAPVIKLLAFISLYVANYVQDKNTRAGGMLAGEDDIYYLGRLWNNQVFINKYKILNNFGLILIGLGFILWTLSGFLSHYKL